MRIFLLFISIFFSGLVVSQTQKDVGNIIKNYDLENLKRLQILFKNKEDAELSAARTLALQNGWPLQINKDGVYQELMKLTPDGFPLYYSTESNVIAARSTRTNFLNSGGGLGLSLDGQNMIARVWDGGPVRGSHQAFYTSSTNTTSRITNVDESFSTPSDNSTHGTHVTGTILALPWNTPPTIASTRGMATQATARTFNWTNDESEALSEVSIGMLVSNHSYGIPLSGSNGPLPAWYIGSYVSDSKDWDEIVYNSPYYLPVFSAGNDGLNNGNSDPITFGFDKLIGNKVAKNVLTVANAEDATISADGSLLEVFINASSSQGPTDDRRIKPDITGNGTGLTSPISTSDTATSSLSGTSMAAPNVAGTLLLLQQHNKNLTNGFLKSATLKGLACHTADDAGEIGPDPVFGWGLLNAKRAAETLSNNGLSSWISEERLNQGQTFTMTVRSNGGTNNPLVASITWTDLPGQANNGQRLTPNDPFRALINDLDIRVTRNGSTFFPWRLNNVDPTFPAVRTGDNNIDNVEIIRIDNPVAGDYVITITHKGNLVSGGQDYSLIITGLASNFSIVPTSENIELCSNQTATYTFAYKQSLSGTTNFSATGIPTGATVSFSPTNLSTNGNVTMTVSNLSAVNPGEYNIGIVGNNGVETETRNRILQVFSSTFEPIVLSSPSNGFNGSSTSVNLDWQPSPNAENYRIQVSRNSNFTSLIINQITTETNYRVFNLNQDTVFYWRVIPSNRCGVAEVNNMPISSFRTGNVNCGNNFTATNYSNATISTSANSTASIPVNVTGGLTIGELRVSMTMSHTYVQDLTIRLQGPTSIGSPLITLFEESCGSQDNINCRFLDSGIEPDCSGTPAVSGDIVPKDFLSSLNGLNADGIWTLLINDPYSGDGGTVSNFSIEICALQATLSSNENVLGSLKVYPNPAKGIVNIDLAGTVTGETTYELFDVQGRKVVSKVSSNSIETLNVENLSDGIYMLSIQNGSAKTTKRVVINK